MSDLDLLECCQAVLNFNCDGFKFPEAPAKTFLKSVIGEIRNKRLEELLCQKE